MNISWNTNVREYMLRYADDSLWEECNPTLKFKDVLLKCFDRQDVYDLIGVGDSILRETLFDTLSSLLLCCDYDEVYKRWLNDEPLTDYILFASPEELSHICLVGLPKKWKDYIMDSI